MSSKKPKTSNDRANLPKELEVYLQVLEGKIPTTKLHGLLREDVRWTRDGRSNMVKGRDVVSKQIESWLDSVEDVNIQIQQI